MRNLSSVINFCSNRRAIAFEPLTPFGAPYAPISDEPLTSCCSKVNGRSRREYTPAHAKPAHSMPACTHHCRSQTGSPLEVHRRSFRGRSFVRGLPPARRWRSLSRGIHSPSSRPPGTSLTCRGSRARETALRIGRASPWCFPTSSLSGGDSRLCPPPSPGANRVLMRTRHAGRRS